MADHSYQIGERAQGRYEILALLPPHTLGVLYRAVDRDPGSAGQERLLCVIGRALLPSDDARAGFVRKVGLARGLRLPQLMSLHDVVITQGPDGAQVLLVAEWAGLDRLRDRLEQRRMERSRWPLPATEAWSALSEVALAMGALHKAAEVLGDLRAENVFITPTGVKLLQHGEGLAVQRATRSSSFWSSAVKIMRCRPRCGRAARPPCAPMSIRWAPWRGSCFSASRRN